jgi:transposase
MRKIGADVTETLELIPRRWKVIQHAREKFACQACEAITQPPAPSHQIARGCAGPKLLAHMMPADLGYLGTQGSDLCQPEWSGGHAGSA